MKFVIGILLVVGVVGLYAAASGDPRVLTVVGGHVVVSQVIALLLAVTSLIASYGCLKKKVFGWYLVTALIVAELAWLLFRAAYLALTLDLDWLGTLLGGIGELVKVGVIAWLLFRYWFKQRAYFQKPNQPAPAQRP